MLIEVVICCYANAVNGRKPFPMLIVTGGGGAWCPYHTEFWAEKTNSLPDFLCQTSRKHDSNQLYAIMNWVWKPHLRRHNRICIGHFLWKFEPGIWQCNLKIVSESWWIPFDRDYIQYSLILNTGLNILYLS